MNPSLHVTGHAVDRFRDRVDRSATRAEAIKAIRRISESAHICSRPRKWCRLAGVGTVPGTRYLYSAVQPGVCLVVRGNAVVTVFSREACAEWRIPTIGVAA